MYKDDYDVFDKEMEYSVFDGMTLDEVTSLLLISCAKDIWVDREQQ